MQQASAGTPTSLTIPEWVIRVENVRPSASYTSSVTEVVLPHKGGNRSSVANFWWSARVVV